MPGSSRSVEFYLRELESLRERHCTRVLADARTQAQEIVKPAFQEGRLRTRAALAEQRERLQKKIEAAEARLRAARLQQRHRQQARLLRLAYEQLRQSLARRWLDPPSRRQWIFTLLGDGVKRLPPSGWQIRHPEDWGAEEIEAARQYLEGQLIQSPDFTPDSGLQAGLRIHCQGVVLDGSVSGLTSDRHRIEARLLALLNTQGDQEPHEQSTDSLD
jgi:hypothetical protein